jgi:hypothetical protein
LSGGPIRFALILVGAPAAVGGALVRLATDSWPFAVAGAAVVAAPALVWVNRSRRRAARFAQRDDAEIDRMVAELVMRRPADGASSLVFEVDTTMSARQFADAGRYDAAARVLNLLDWQRIEGEVMFQAASTMAFCCIRSGFVTKARDALVCAEGKLLDQGKPEVLEILDGRLLVHEGKSEEAFHRLERLESLAARNPSLRADVLVLKAHALADRGDHDGALTVIGTLRSEVGQDAFSLLARPEGAASDLAAQLATRSAYR